MTFDGWDSPGEPPQQPRGRQSNPNPADTPASATPLAPPQPEHDARHWQSAAACRGSAAELFDFAPVGRGTSGRSRVLAAKQVCNACPVRTQCLQYALTHAEPHGIWGGLTTPERHKLAGGKQRPRRAAPTGHPSIL